jgi:hypothetical protein
MLEIASAAVPELVSVIGIDLLVVPTTSPPKFKLVGEKVTAGAAWFVPVPLRPTVCGLPAALSVTEIVPLSVPVVVGENVTLIVQLLPAFSDEGQLLVWLKFVLAVILEIVNAAVPEFVNVTGCDWLLVPTTWFPKVRLPVEKEIPGCVPVPDRETVCGPAGALLVMEMVPLREPVFVGAKVTLIVQLLPAFNELPQVFVSPKLALAAMLVMLRAALPEFVSVTGWLALVVPTTWLLKVRLPGESVTPG